MLQDFLPADDDELRCVDDMILLWNLLVSVVVWVEEREEHSCFLNIAII